MHLGEFGYTPSWIGVKIRVPDGFGEGFRNVAHNNLSACQLDHLPKPTTLEASCGQQRNQQLM
jgi:hypothetical protein